MTETQKKIPMRVFAGVSSFEMIVMFRRGLFYSYLSVYLRHYLGLSVTETTLFATLPMVMNVLFQRFVWGVFSDRFQLRRTIIICGELLAAAGTVVVWYGHTLTASLAAAGYVIIAGLSVIEIFWSMSNVGWSALISDIYPQKERNAIQGRLASIGGMGRIMGVWIGGVLYDGMGAKFAGWGFYDGALFFTASAAMLISVVPMLFVPEGGIRYAAGSAEEKSAEPPAGATKLFTTFIIAMVFINFGRNAIAVIVTQYLTADPGPAVSSQTLSYIVNTQSVAIILTGLAAGWVGKRLGESRSLVFGTMVSIVSLILLAVTMALKWIYFSNFLRGFSEVIIMASSYALASALIAPENRARGFAVFNATFFLSWGTAGTFIAGPVADLLMAHGASEAFAYQMSFAVSAGLTAVGLFILLSLRPIVSANPTD